MESNESPSLDWKICIKKVLAPQLLNQSNNEEQNYTCSSNLSGSKEQNIYHHPSNTFVGEEQSDACHNISGPKSVGDKISKFLTHPENVQDDVASPITAKVVHNDDITKSFIDCFRRELRNCDSLDSTIHDSENPDEMDEDVDGEMDSDVEAEVVVKNFRNLKKITKNKYFNLAESSCNTPDWNLAIKNVFCNKSGPEGLQKTQEKIVDEEAYLSQEPYLFHPESFDSWDTYPMDYNRRWRSAFEKNTEVDESYEEFEKRRSERQYTKEEKETLRILRSARRFKPLKRNDPPKRYDFIDEARAKYFKEIEKKSFTKKALSNTKKPRNVSPPGGVKPLSFEDTLKSPPNVIFSEWWDDVDGWWDDVDHW